MKIDLGFDRYTFSYELLFCDYTFSYELLLYDYTFSYELLWYTTLFLTNLTKTDPDANFGIGIGFSVYGR